MRVYRTITNKNLKKCAASRARPAIQYVLYRRISEHSRPMVQTTDMVATIIFGIILSGMASKINLDSSHAVGL